MDDFIKKNKSLEKYNKLPMFVRKILDDNKTVLKRLNESDSSKTD